MDHSPPPSRPPQLTIKADDQIAKGRFTNLSQISHSPESFVLDFSFVQGATGWLLSRLIISPGHMKRFHAMLGDTIARYEERYGAIDSGPTLQ